MKHNAANDDVKQLFDGQFDYFDDVSAAVVPSWGCTGSCVCCSGGCDSCF